MKMNQKISIIVPVYNVEAYLDRCIKSILSQTYKNIELLLIDDGSSDESGKICDRYSELDPRCKTYHKINSGVSATRNLGIRNATGDWIGFVDSDDWIDPETYELAIKTAIEKQVDIVQWQISTFTDSGLERTETNIESTYFDLNNNTSYCRPNSVTLLIKKSLLIANNIMYPENAHLSEDRLFAFECYLSTKKCFHIGKCLYHYYMRSNSASHSITLDMIKEEICVINRIEEIAKERKKDLLSTEWLYNQKKDVKIHLILSLSKPDFKLGREIYPEINKKLVKEHSKFGFVFFFVNYRIILISKPLVTFWKWYSRHHNRNL